MKCLLLNARSIVNKLPELHNVMYVEDFDLILITETWLHEGISSGVLDPPSAFNIIRQDRTGSKHGGGVCAMIKKMVV